MSKRPDGRPVIASITTGAEFKRWYWLKSELDAHVKTLGLKRSGGKFDLVDRIAHFLDTGEPDVPKPRAPKPKSKFDWHRAELTPETVITDSYKNSQNVRRFFRSQVGDGFKFNIEFMAWMRANSGRTLADACTEYRAMKAREAAPDFQSEIAHHNQFNQYTRDFLADNPHLGMTEVRRYWRLKRALPSETGRHVYDPSDLQLTDAPE